MAPAAPSDFPSDFPAGRIPTSPGGSSLGTGRSLPGLWSFLRLPGVGRREVRWEVAGKSLFSDDEADMLASCRMGGRRRTPWKWMVLTMTEAMKARRISTPEFDGISQAD